MNYSARLQSFRGHKYQILLMTLLLLAVFFPIAEGDLVGEGVFALLYCLILLAGIFALSQKRRPFTLAMVLGIPGLVVLWVAYGIGRTSVSFEAVLLVARETLHLAFLAVLVWYILKDILLAGKVTFDKLAGAACVYILLGTIWTLIYILLFHFEPSAFAGPLLAELPAASADPHHEVFAALLYYSFVTLTTLGYGDITPVSSAARSLTWLEALVGQLFLAVLIARHVGLHIAQTAHGGETLRSEVEEDEMDDT